MSEEPGFRLHWAIRIPVRDGAHLNATVYRPENRTERLSCVVLLTPYVADSHHVRAVYLASRGICTAVVDVRGRGNSDGTFRPFIQEAEDGYDVVEWVARQPYCNGKVAMCGSSYLGYCQWAVAKEFPPHLATIVPAGSPYLGVDFPFRKNIYYPHVVRWLALTSGKTAQDQIFADSTFWSGALREWHESGRPFRDLAAAAGSQSGVFLEWLAHPEPDGYWDARNPTAEQYSRLRIPVLTITGSYDDDQPGALEHYRQHLRQSTSQTRHLHYLVIGPWDHAGTGWAPSPEFGGVKLGPASCIDVPKLHFDWYCWIMQGGPKPEFLQRPVVYYVMGADEWRYADTLDGVTRGYRKLYLDSKINAHDVFLTGSLGDGPGTGAADSYTYDPSQTRGLEVEAEAHAADDSLIDQRTIFALREKALIYHSEPFEVDTEISGFFKLSVWIGIDCPDTDLYASVYEINVDGSSLRLSTDAIRARYREGLRAAKAIDTQAPLRYDFTCFTFVSRQVRRGRRLRLVVAPFGHVIDAAFTQKNYNGGGIVAEESVEDSRRVTVTLFHDDSHPSALQVPLGQQTSGDGSAGLGSVACSHGSPGGG